MTTSLVKMMLVLAVIAVGVSLKVSRYAAAHTAIPTASLDRIVRTMAGHGWVLVSKAETATSTLYDHLGFQRPGCDAIVTIAAMGGNAEAAEFFRQRYGGDAAFIQGGAVVERPSGVRRQLAILTHHARTILRLPIKPVMPILAISPAPSQSECHGPPASAWRNLQMSSDQMSSHTQTISTSENDNA